MRTPLIARVPTKHLKIAVVTQYFPVSEQPYRGHSAYQTLRCLARMANVHVFAPQARYPSMLVPRNRAWAKTDLSYLPADIETTYFAGNNASVKRLGDESAACAADRVVCA
jgi:hypothetical protein